MTEKTLYHGDNLKVLRRHVKDDSVDLVYLDPPFKSNQDYNLLFEKQEASRAATQIRAFEDTWSWDEAACSAYTQLVETGGRVADAMRAFRTLLGTGDMLAYLSMMAPRLVELRRVLKREGSIYLHCDAAAGHYLKVLMDAIFGPENFRREIIWRSGWVSGFKTKTANWVRNHDTLLYYLRDRKHGFTFHKDFAYKPHEEGYARRGGGGNPLGVAIDDVWDDVELYSPWIKSFSTEKLGYMTQKPLALLERILSVSSNKNDVVLDPFCGGGTAIAAAEHLQRQWIGIDITHLAINLVRHRLQDQFGLEPNAFNVIGLPVSLSDAQALASQDRFQFQWWALGLVGARPADAKKGADGGIDGRLYFHDERGGATKQAVVSVKSGNVGVKDMRELSGVVEQENAEMGVLITLQEPTQPMRAWAAGKGRYRSPWGDYPRFQIITVAELLAGQAIDRPPTHVTFKRTSKLPSSATQTKLPLE